MSDGAEIDTDGARAWGTLGLRLAITIRALRDRNAPTAPGVLFLLSPTLAFRCKSRATYLPRAQAMGSVLVNGISDARFWWQEPTTRSGRRLGGQRAPANRGRAHESRITPRVRESLRGRFCGLRRKREAVP